MSEDSIVRDPCSDAFSLILVSDMELLINSILDELTQEQVSNIFCHSVLFFDLFHKNAYKRLMEVL